MYKLTNPNVNGDLVTAAQAAERTNLGVTTVRARAAECGAALKIGKSYRINIKKLLDYLCTFEAEIR